MYKFYRFCIFMPIIGIIFLLTIRSKYNTETSEDRFFWNDNDEMVWVYHILLAILLAAFIFS